ncbi:MAG TPA: DUF559 domain-containing protein [Sphingomicrobium sp.]|nr:DUF559 domain-containing protein [Sphingomicrobium sp.]
MVDFYCPAARLIVEVDGDRHRMGNRPQRDERRDTWLSAQGLRVIRFDATDVMNELESVVTTIVRACRSQLPLHRLRRSPSPLRSQGGSYCAATPTGSPSSLTRASSFSSRS